MSTFSAAVISWQQQHGRHHLPWQKTRDPYRIWLSEIMLQQTQVSTVIPYFEKFIARFPDVCSLAQASSDEVMALWSGLGYYARARNLHRCAQVICSEHGGRFPQRAETIATLPGIGRSTAAAIAAFAFGERTAILDGNVKRVLCRYFGVEGFPSQSMVEKKLWVLAEQQLPSRNIETYTQGLMDLGATLCLRSQPACPRCPLQETCIAHRSQRTITLPTPRPARAQPQRYALMLVLCHGPDVLLEKRPASGIWGGLWSLPQLDLNADEFPSGIAHTPLQLRIIERLERCGLRAEDVARITERNAFTHTFTHFKLHALPVQIVLQNRPAALERSGRLWLALSALDDTGLPAPVRRLLATV
ncbi:MAG: A/G-specific adenine glycosylase [Burkholderiaceae bacterium]|nr:MAG: A/G-specific adenine glycosylase [Burkholderiaceae bacterium]